jgi:hypothetical protein
MEAKKLGKKTKQTQLWLNAIRWTLITKTNPMQRGRSVPLRGGAFKRLVASKSRFIGTKTEACGWSVILANARIQVLLLEAGSLGDGGCLFPFYLPLCHLRNLWFRLFSKNKPNFFTTKYALSNQNQRNGGQTLNVAQPPSAVKSTIENEAGWKTGFEPATLRSTI